MGDTYTGRLPDFFIVGAAKSATTSFHHILNQHKHVFMPEREMFFFDIDDLEEHPDFFIESPGGRSFYDYDRHFDEYLAWYGLFFKNAREDQVIGERSTTYMASEKAPGRIAKLIPGAKLIFMLRDPVSRTYSQYWHLVRTGRAIYGFKKTLQRMPGTLIKRGLYKSQIGRYKEYFPEKNMRFVIFEEFIRSNQSNIDGICKFLGLETGVDISEAGVNITPSSLPKYIGLQLIHNRIFRNVADRLYLDKLPNNTSERRSFSGSMERLLRKLNPAAERPYPAMKPDTRRFLQELFAKENRGLSGLIGQDVQKYWPYMRE